MNKRANYSLFVRSFPSVIWLNLHFVKSNYSKTVEIGLATAKPTQKQFIGYNNTQRQYYARAEFDLKGWTHTLKVGTLVVVGQL